jgi:hypothetical protein
MDSHKRYDRLKYRDMRDTRPQRYINAGYISRRVGEPRAAAPQNHVNSEVPKPEPRKRQFKVRFLPLRNLTHSIKVPKVSRRWQSTGFAGLMVLTSLVFLFSNVAQAAVSLRASNSASVSNQIKFSGGSLATGTSVGNTGSSTTTSVSATMPTGVVAGDVMVAAVTVTGGSGITFTVPSGWASLQRQNSTTALGQELYWKQASAGEAGPYQWSWTGNQKASVVIMAYTNVAASSPIDVSNGQANPSSPTITAPSVTPTADNEMLVGFFGELNSATITSTTLATLETQTAASGGGATSRTATAGADTLLGAGTSGVATGTKTATINSGGTSAVNIGQLVAIKPNAATTLTLNKPSGTVSGDVMLAAITITGGTGVTFTPPSGWSSVQRHNSTTVIGQEVWYKVAGGSEPASYDWTWTGARAASGVISSYSGVDPTTPVDVNGGQANASSTTITAPSVTTTGTDDLLVGFFGVANGGTVTAVSPLTDRTYSAATGASNLTAIRGADEYALNAGSTGTRTATAGNAGVNIGQLVALKPYVSTLTQASHRWFSQDDRVAGINWIGHKSAAENQWSSVTHGNGLFVAVSGDGTNRVMTSSDGITWTPRSAAAANTWQSVTYGNGLFVAVDSMTGNGTSGSVMTSPDGITWTSRTAAADNTWNSVTHGNDLFVAVSGDGTNRVMTSSDGITWTPRTAAAVSQWTSVTYGNGLFVAVDAAAGNGSSGSVMTSPDGITWSSRTAASDEVWDSITYGNGLFVAVSTTGGSSRVMTSPDGITWTSRTSATNNWTSVTYGNGLFVAVATNGTNRVMTSTDGIIWSLRNHAATNLWTSVTFGNNKFVAVAFSGAGDRVMTSDAEIQPTAATWTTRTSAADNSWKSVTYGNGLFVAVAENGSGNRIMTSSDGMSWSSRTNPDDRIWYSVTYGNGLFVAVAGDPSTFNSVMTSPDGITWTSRATSELHIWTSVTYGNGLFVAVAGSGTSNRVMTSPDGITWTPRASVADNSWKSVTYGNGLFVAVALDGTNRVMTSPDGTTWTARTAAAAEEWQSITYGNGLFVAVSFTDSGVMTSPDGITWTARTSAEAGLWRAITYGNGLFVVIGSSSIMTSPDGINWTSRTAAAGNNWDSVTYGNGLFVAVGFTGTGDRVMTAPAIDAAVDGALSSQDSVLTNTTNDSVRLRMNLGVATKSLPPGYQKFALQYATRSGGVCSGSDTFYDVGTAPWLGQTVAADNSWQSVTYGNGLFVAVDAATGNGSSGSVMTSPDGITWTSRTAAADNSWNSVTYGNGLFVAVSNDGTNRVMTSPDGITWTSRSAAAANPWYDVTYGNGMFVALSNSGVSNAIMTSPDGITWTPRTTPVWNAGWSSIAYGNGLFVVVRYGGTDSKHLTSSDGITWTTRDMPINVSLDSVAYGNGLFVAVSDTGNDIRVVTSPDGINWTSRNASANQWLSVTYGNGLFVAVSGGGDEVMTSPDGVTWTDRTLPVNISNGSVTYGDGRFVTVSYNPGSTANRSMTMSPPVNWGGQVSNNYGAATSNGSDPTQGGSTIRKQNYITNNYFSNNIDTATSEYAMWDFDLDLSRGTYESSYCFRIVNQSGSLLNTYSTYPEITKCTAPSLDRRLRHGAAFCGNVKRFYWTRATS